VLIRLAGQYRQAAAVVTSDRRVATAGQRAGCAVIGAERFLSATAGGGDGDPDDGDPDDDDEDGGERRGKAGNPRRLSREARAAQRALRRLGPH
jgi:hypothetical protein